MGNRVRVLINLFFIILCFCLLNTSASAMDFQKDTNNQSTSKQNQSFFHRTLEGKYNLIEEDFDDVPRRTTKYDYIKEETEKIRLYSRPDGPEYAILNLQLKRGNIFINNFETVSGEIKKRKWLSGGKKNGFFFRLFADNKNPVYEGQLEIPFDLHFDFADEETWEMTGGALNRTDLDFTLKIPLPDKSAQKIIFYKKKDFDSFKKRQSIEGQEYSPAEEEEEVILGETQF